VAPFGRTIIYIEWGRQETQALWRGETFGERSFENLRRRITLYRSWQGLKVNGTDPGVID